MLKCNCKKNIFISWLWVIILYGLIIGIVSCAAPRPVSPDLSCNVPREILQEKIKAILEEPPLNLNVISAYASELTANTIPVAVLTSWRPTIKLIFKNTGTKTWDNPVLKSYDIDYTNSWFRDWSWHDNKTIEKSRQNIEPGQEITFIFKIKPYWKRNTYPHVYKLFDDDEEIHINGKTEYLTYTRVD